MKKEHVNRDDIKAASVSYCSQIAEEFRKTGIIAGVIVIILPKGDFTEHRAIASNLSHRSLRDQLSKAQADVALEGMMSIPMPTPKVS